MDHVPERGIFQSDAAAGHRTYVVYVAGRRVIRLELTLDDDCIDEDRDATITFLWRFLVKHDRRLSLVD